MHVSVCHILTSTSISHSFMKQNSPNLQRMFIAVKHGGGGGGGGGGKIYA